MLNDNEFMNGVWKKVNVLEWQEAEKERAFKLDKKIRDRNRKIYTTVFIISSVLAISSYFEAVDKVIVLGITLVTSIIGLVLALIYELRELSEAN